MFILEPKKYSGKRKIDIEYIQDKVKRGITFSKRKYGLMKKASELSILTGSQVLLLVVSDTGHVYTYSTPMLQPIVTQHEGKQLIQNCLKATKMKFASQENTPSTPSTPSTSSTSSTSTSSTSINNNFIHNHNSFVQPSSPPSAPPPPGSIY